MKLTEKKTRFVAYQLGNAGSSFSYCDSKTFTLIEARLTDLSEPSLRKELSLFNKKCIDVLHITSWDNDHCNPKELNQILIEFTPKTIEFPSYQPHTISGLNSLDLIKKYKNDRIKQNILIDLVEVNPNSQKTVYTNSYSDIHFPHKKEYSNSNNNSLVKLFRSGSFTVLSLGDVELPEIAETLMKSTILTSQVDVMILAHHGADNGFTTEKFIRAINPKIAICSSNYINKFTHPRPKIRDLLYLNSIRIFTTKTGDIVIKSEKNHTGEFSITNRIGNNLKISSKYLYKSKRLEKNELLEMMESQKVVIEQKISFVDILRQQLWKKFRNTKE